jgi:DNA-binding MarR family transcriptional regulator
MRRAVGVRVSRLDFDGSNDEIISTAELRASLRRFFRRTEICARQSGLTPRQYLLLIFVRGAPMQLAQSTVTELVARAATAGLVETSQSKDDGRVTEVRVALEGEHRMLACFEALGHERRALREALREHIAVGV